MERRTLENRFLSLSVDARGRVVSLINKLTRTELITRPRAAEAWCMIVPTGRHTVDKVLGSEQTPKSIELLKEDGRQSIAVAYDRVRGSRWLPVRARFVLSLEEGTAEIAARVELDNRGPLPVEEVEFPVVGGLGGYPGRGRKRPLHLVAAGDQGHFFDDVLAGGLPVTGRESHHFVREHETAMFEADRVGGVWLDLWCERQGLFLGYCSRTGDFAFKVEKVPKEVPNAPAHRYPAGTVRWLRASAVHVPRLVPGGRWNSEPVIIMPHKRDWHAGADRYGAYRHERLALATPPAWMDDFVGWTEILGKTYLGEVFHDYARCADAVVRDKRLTGLDLVFYYGHSRIGAEGADFDYSAAPDMGGVAGFRRMVEKLHRNGIRIILLDHLHRWINRDVPEHASRRLAAQAVLDADGKPVTARWWKETFLSCRRLAGPTPVWVEMCPASKKWRRIYLDHVTKMIELGVDGLELDTFGPSPCYSRRHGHRPGADMLPAKLEFVGQVRAHAKRLNPDFVLFGETMVPETRQVLDGFYPFRYLTEDDRIYRYLFPEIRQQAVLVGNYAYDQVNKALSLGIGVDTEIWGLRRTAAEACPELARYVGEVNRFRKEHPELLIRGTFRDTVGAQVWGDCLYAVLRGPGRSRALVLRNHHPRPVRARAILRSVTGLRLILWRPFAGQRRLRSLPLRVLLRPYEVAVLLGLERA